VFTQCDLHRRINREAMKRLKEAVRALPTKSFTGLGVPTLYMKGATQPNRRGKMPRMPVEDPDWPHS
jgi:hypothetical protein